MEATARRVNRGEREQGENISSPDEAKVQQAYKEFFHGNGKPMVIIEEDATISLANEEFERFSGYRRDEIEGKKKWTAFVAREDRKRLREYHLLRKSDPMLAPRAFEFRFVDRRGAIKNVVLTIGQIPGTAKSMASLQDVTDLRHAETTRRASEERYRKFFENSPDAVYITTADGSYVDANRAALELFGYSREELKRIKAIQLYANPADAKRLREELEKKDYVQDFEVRVRRKDGALVDCLFTVTTLRGEDGKILEYQGIARDVTAQRRAAEVICRSEERHREILEAMLEGYFEVDLAGNLTDFNEAVNKFFGYTREELLGKNYREITTPQEGERLKEVFNEVYRTGSPKGIAEYEMIKKDGGRAVAEFSVLPLRDAAGRIVGFWGVTRDVTDKKIHKEKIEDIESRYRTALEEIAEGYFENDLAGNLTFFNNSLLDIYGYTRDELLAMNYRQYMDEENAKKVYDAYHRVYLTGVPEHGLQFEIIRKDGTRRWLENSISLMRDRDERPIGFRGISRDITRRKEMEEALRVSEERLRSVIEATGDAYVETDLSGRVEFINRAAIRFLGWSDEEFIGKHYKEFTDPENAKKVYEIYNRVYRTGETARLVEYEHIAKDGSRKVVESTIALRRDKEGKPIGFKAITRDITKKKELEERLRQSEERFRSIVENMQEAYYETDLGGHFIYINNALCRDLGYTKEELLGVTSLKLQDEEEAKRTFEAFKQLYNTGEPLRFWETQYISKDGTKRYYQLSADLIRDAQGNPIGFKGVSRDITEKKRHEERLRRYAAELERSNEEVKNFAYIVSHDLRVPLVNLKGYTSELKSALEVISSSLEAALPHLSEEKRREVAVALHEDIPEALEFIANSVSRMDSFINAILILSRLGRQELKPERIDMQELVQKTLETLAHQIKAKGIEVIISPLPTVVADRTAMEQVMGNILGNAVKYKDPERPLRIEVKGWKENGETVIAISDTGRGIAQEDMHKVFAPFRRAGKQDTPGEGMGLAYVQTIVRRHGGRIWCESELGKGTTFTFTIPELTKDGKTDV